MNKEEFNYLLDELDGTSLNTLKEKNGRYAPDDDALHNFHIGAEIMGCTTAQCAWGYAVKHIVALRDKIMRDDFSDKEDTLEKIQDIINYLRFIWCAANESRPAVTNTKENDSVCTYKSELSCGCEDCLHSEEDDGFDFTTNKCTKGPCASCKANFTPHEAEYETAPNNFCCKYHEDPTQCGIINEK